MFCHGGLSNLNDFIIRFRPHNLVYRGIFFLLYTWIIYITIIRLPVAYNYKIHV